MKRAIAKGIVGFGLLAMSVLPTANAQIGPDVIVGDLPSVRYWGSVGDIAAYSIGTTSCNIGDEDLLWISSTNQHPVIGQNMYRLKNGRLEQVGQSWLKHGFTAINNGICGQCNGHLGSVLGVGCSDPYGAGLNGSQSRLGPKSEVNATTGFYPYPYGIGWQQTGNDIYKRLQVRRADIDPAQNPGALYFIEGHYVTPDDAAAGNGLNNASYRRVSVSSVSNVNTTGTTQREKPAIWAWRDHGLGVNTPDPNVEVVSVDVPNDGRFWVAAKASDLGGGIFRYEYAVQNLNSDRSGGSFSVPLPTGAFLANVNFHDTNYHSGEPWDNSDWRATVAGGTITWYSPETFAQNPGSNALRWSTLYNFSFDTDVAPSAGSVLLGLFKPGNPGDPDEMSVALSAVPSTGAGCAANCAGDINGDNVTDLVDLGILLSNFGCANCACEQGNLDGIGSIDLMDLGILLADWGCVFP